MMNFGQSNVKREQKTALFLREISNLIQQLSLDEPDVAKVYVTNVRLSKDYGICFVYFASFKDPEDFNLALEKLKLYKPSLRKALSQKVAGRYTPNLVFLYDKAKEKERNINKLLDEVSQDKSQEE